MIKRFISALMLILLLSVPSYPLSDSEYLSMKRSSSDFARADRKLNQVWANLKKTLPKNVFTQLDKLQKEWLKSGRDEAAEKLMNDGYSRMEAYTMATSERAAELPEIVREVREEMRQRRRNSQPQTRRTQPAPDPEPDPDPAPEPAPEPEAEQEYSRPVEISGEYKNNTGFITVKIIDRSTNEAEVTASRYKDGVHWTARGWVDNNVLELSDSNYSECQATLTFSEGSVKVDISETSDWNEAISPDFVLAGIYRK